MLDPFRHVGDYGQPRTGLLPIGNRRYAAGMITLALAIGAAMLLTVGAIAHASTTPQPGTVQIYRGPIGAGPRPTVRSLTRAIVTSSTVTVDRITYRALPVIRYTPQEPLCRASQAGKLGMVVGDRTPFLVRCRADGDVWVWDADLR